MRLFVHALGASAGGGLTYLRNLLPQLAARSDVAVTVLAGGSASAAIPAAGNLEILEAGSENRGPLSRFLWEQRQIPKLIRKAGSDVLLSAGNFAIWNSPVPQILLSRNSLYTSDEFRRDLARRGAYALWADTLVKGWFARMSIEKAQLTLTPSESFAQEIRSWSGHQVAVLHHGFDRDFFFRDESGAPPARMEKIASAEGVARLLFVSHYNYYRNFETLLRALPLIKQKRDSGKIRLLLTCEFEPGKNPGSYRTEGARELLRELAIEEDVVQLGAVPYHQLHHLYRACDIYVTPAYTETFAHPLVEAMACGTPIVASDLAVHREITNGAALFFDPFSPADLADRVIQLLDSVSLQADLKLRGLRRAEDFNWKDHAERLLAMAGELVARSKA